MMNIELFKKKLRNLARYYRIAFELQLNSLVHLYPINSQKSEKENNYSQELE